MRLITFKEHKLVLKEDLTKWYSELDFSWSYSQERVNNFKKALARVSTEQFVLSHRVFSWCWFGTEQERRDNLKNQRMCCVSAVNTKEHCFYFNEWDADLFTDFRLSIRILKQIQAEQNK